MRKTDRRLPECANAGMDPEIRLHKMRFPDASAPSDGTFRVSPGLR